MKSTKRKRKANFRKHLTIAAPSENPKDLRRIMKLISHDRNDR
jgi:hypothetical protein